MKHHTKLSHLLQGLLSILLGVLVGGGFSWGPSRRLHRGLVSRMSGKHIATTKTSPVRPRKVVTASAAIFVLALMLSASASAQNPANCNANLLDITISRDRLAVRPGETVNYFVIVVNRSEIGVQIGCNTLDVTADFFCPGATGLPDGPSTNLATNVDIPANDFLAVSGPLPCTMPDIDPGTATAGVRGDGTLDDGLLSPFLINKDVAVVVQSCLVQVDKQISCDRGATWVDQGLVFANEGGSQGCTTADGTPILVRYQVHNAGLAPLHACVLTETNTAFGAPASLPTPIAFEGTTAFIPALQTPVCSDALENNEPNTASVSCFCQPDLDPNDKVSASDSADLTCQSSPQLSLTKICADPGPDGTNAITITAAATDADLGFVDCHVSDNIFLDDTSCPADVGSGTAVTVAPADFNLAAGESQIVTGSVGPLAANACNTASITCTVETTGVEVTVDADAVCPAPGEGCFTHTPGFWGNHPAITSQFLNVEVCGVTIDNVLAFSGTSAIEAICSVGRDGEILGPQLTQLVRQCTAAALNIAASGEGGGNCSSEFPNLETQMDACCSAQSACTGFLPPGGFTVNSCIEILDAFNNSIDTLPPFGPFVSPGPADSSACRDARNNGVVVTPAP
jgi:hypothetical protein